MESQSGFELFIRSAEGFELAYRMTLADIPQGVALEDELRNACARLASRGFVRSERLDKPARGGGGNPNWQPKPEQPAPDAQVPKHCAQDMKYVSFKDKQGTEREKYECRKGKECPEGNQYGGYTLWRDQWLKKLNGRKQQNTDENPFASEPDPIEQFM